MNFTLSMNCDNAAFADLGAGEDGSGALPEVGRILQVLANKLRTGLTDGTSGRLHDGNGNTVGEWSID